MVLLQAGKNLRAEKNGRLIEELREVVRLGPAVHFPLAYGAALVVTVSISYAGPGSQEINRFRAETGHFETNAVQQVP
jgi:hypothetical protein